MAFLGLKKRFKENRSGEWRGRNDTTFQGRESRQLLIAAILTLKTAV